MNQGSEDGEKDKKKNPPEQEFEDDPAHDNSEIEATEIEDSSHGSSGFLVDFSTRQKRSRRPKAATNVNEQLRTQENHGACSVNVDTDNLSRFSEVKRNLEPQNAKSPRRKNVHTRYQPTVCNSEILYPDTLVKMLVSYPNLEANLLQLVEDFDLHPSSVRKIVSENSHVFTLTQDRVILYPKLEICSDHLGANGCRLRLTCNDIHLCSLFVMDQCEKSDCLFGHKFKTNHNLSIFNRFHIDNLSSSDLKLLFKSFLSNPLGTKTPIEICHAYNTGNCEYTPCNLIHVCADFILGKMNCSKPNCNLNHNLLSQETCLQLNRHGIDTNDTPRDVLASLLEINPDFGVLKDSLNIENRRTDPLISDTASRINIDNNSVKDSDATASSINNLNPNQSNISSVQTITSLIPNRLENSHSSRGQNEEDFFSFVNTVDLQSRIPSTQVSTLISQDTERSFVSGFNSTNANKTSNITLSSDINDNNENVVDDNSINIRDSLIIDTDEEFQRLLSNSEDSASNSEVDYFECSSYLISEITIASETIVNSNVEERNENGNELQVQSPSLWSHHLEGDVKLAEICYDSVVGICPKENFACPRLHSTRHFHWQISEDNSSWLNLENNQVMLLERAFCDPGTDTAVLPGLNRDQLEGSMAILSLIMGEEIWTSNLQGMILTNEGETKILYLRRLSTEIIPGITIQQSIYRWFYCNDNDLWVEYGESDENGCSYINSEAIESQYIINPYSFVQFTISDCEHLLDFNTMTQVNLDSQAQSKVRRRPKPHLGMDNQDD